MKDESKSFFAHLDELRKRIVISAFATAIGVAVSFVFRDRLFDVKRGLLMFPLRIRTSDILSYLFSIISRAGIDSTFINLFQLFCENSL